MKRLLFISMIALFGCDKNEVEKPIVYKLGGSDGFHYAIPHNTGNEQEDPNTGCPCLVLFNGWSSYSNYTNAMAHGVESLYDAYRLSVFILSSQEKAPVRLCDVYEFEQKLINKWNDSSKTESGGEK